MMIGYNNEKVNKEVEWRCWSGEVQSISERYLLQDLYPWDDN